MAQDQPATPARGNSAYVTVEHDGWIAESNTHTEEALRAALGAPSVDEETSEAASKLGKKGAAAKKAKPAPKAKDDDEADEPPSAQGADKGAKAPDAKKKADAKAEESEDEEELEAKAGDANETDEEAEAKRAEAEQLKQRKQRARERVEEATRQTAELKRENRRLQEELTAARLSKPAAAEQPKAAPDDDPEPSPDDPKYAEGQFDPGYIKDAGRWAARQEFRKQQAKATQKNREEGLRRYVEERGGLVEKGIESEGGEDFLESLSDDVRAIEPSFLALARGERPSAKHALGDEFLRMGEQAPRLMRYLTEHPDVFQRLTSPTLRPSQFEREMGRIEERLDAATAGTPASKPKPISQAPRPARPVAGAPTNADAAPDPRNSSYEEHVSYYNAKERRRSA